MIGNQNIFRELGDTESGYCSLRQAVVTRELQRSTEGGFAEVLHKPGE